MSKTKAPDGKVRTRSRLDGEETRLRMVEAAERIIAEEGLTALTARRVAADCRVAVGTTYNFFTNLDDLLTAVNARTLHRLHAAVEGSVRHSLPPEEQVLSIAECYVDFVQENERLWLALFEVELPKDSTSSQNQVLVDQLFQLLEAPIKAAVPELDGDSLRRSVRGLWAAAHGLLALSAGERLPVIRLESVKPTIRHLVRCHLAGLSVLADKSKEG